MSQENVEIVKRTIDAFNRRDLDTYDEFFTPDSEWVTSMGAIEGETFRGREGAETYIERLDDAWDDTVGGTFVISAIASCWLGRVEGRGRGSGVLVDMPLAQIFYFRGGKICRTRSYLDHGEALEAVGLEE